MFRCGGCQRASQRPVSFQKLTILRLIITSQLQLFVSFVENKSVPGTSLGHVISFVQFVNDLDFFLLDSE